MAAPRKLKAIVTEIRNYDYGITFFRFMPELRCKFNPGQFLHLALDHYDPSFNWPESRVFSIANSPLTDDHIDILVSPKGEFTKRMINTLKVGSEVWIKLPYGIFDFRANINKNIVLIAGGTGISPFISLLEFLLDSNIPSSNRVTLFYGLRELQLIVFEEFLRKCQNLLPNFNLKIYCEQEVNHPVFDICYGTIPFDEIAKEAVLDSNVVFYLSGPPKMILNCETALIKSGISIDQIFFDKWE